MKKSIKRTFGKGLNPCKGIEGCRKGKGRRKYKFPETISKSCNNVHGSGIIGIEDENLYS